MKKVFTFAIIVITFSMFTTSCHKSVNTVVNSKDSTVVDTVKVDTVKVDTVIAKQL